MRQAEKEGWDRGWDIPKRSQKYRGDSTLFLGLEWGFNSEMYD
jgi:hypothetical protein